MPEPDLVAQLIERSKDIDEQNLAEFDALAHLGTTKKGRRWVPQPGPQTDAYFSEADVLLYGGQAGGGKTDLIIGLAFNEHTRSMFVRRRASDMSGLIDRAIEVNGTRKGYSGAPPKSLRPYQGPEDQKFEFIGCPHAGDEQATQGRPRDLLALEEGAQLLESQVRYLMGWVRSTKPGQRCRTIIASNPPLTDEGQWMFEMFRPWLDPTHPYPAKPGELRWYVTDERGHDVPVEGPGEYDIGKKRRDGSVDWVRAQSRTYIPASLDDNAFLRDTNYRATLDTLPEPLRSAMRDGDFQAGRIDDPWQIIPTKWIFEAQNRWTEEPPTDAPMCCIGVDVAQGGTAETVLAPRYDWWFAPLIAAPGSETPHGSDVAALIFKHRQNRASVVIDLGGGYGGGAYEHLRLNLEGDHWKEQDERVVFGFNGANASSARTADRQLPFYNKRAEAWWRFREALDPDQPGGSPVALPPDSQLVADLVSPRYRIEARGILVESKQDIIERLGRSPDRGDAVVMAWSKGPSHLTHGKMWRDFTRNRGGTPKVIRAHTAKKRRK